MLKKTALWEKHIQLGAKMLPFAGYDMPVQYPAGLIDEHLTTRKSCGLFDVSHMGLSWVEGPDTRSFLQHCLSRNIEKLPLGRAQYSLLCRDNGFVVDDLIAYALEENRFLLILNASNKEKDVAYLRDHSQGYAVEIMDPSENHSLIALQGPRSFDILKELSLIQEESKAFRIAESRFKGEELLLAFTGYTGERGCEIVLPNRIAEELWDSLLETGNKIETILPCGLGARDTLRTEMGYSLYGHELSEEIDPLEAGLSWAVDFEKPNFIGQKSLKEKSPKRKLIGLSSASKRAARHGMKVYDAHGQDVGQISSGSYAPSLGHSIAMALVGVESKPPYSVEFHGKKVLFEISERPFYRGKKT